MGTVSNNVIEIGTNNIILLRYMINSVILISI